MRVEDIISEPWVIHPDVVPVAQRPDKVRDLLESVGLRRDHAERYPHQFSGGQLQRIGIARAMTLNPQVLICDEPVSALDLSVQAQVINLFEEIQDRHQIAYVFIAHDLSVVRHMSDRVAVMYLGRIAELGTERQVYGSPRHPYTKALLSAEPTINFTHEMQSRRILLKGEMPSPANPPSGCASAPVAGRRRNAARSTCRIWWFSPMAMDTSRPAIFRNRCRNGRRTERQPFDVGETPGGSSARRFVFRQHSQLTDRDGRRRPGRSPKRR